MEALDVAEGILNVGSCLGACCALELRGSCLGCACCVLVLRDSCLGFGGSSGFLGSGGGRAGEGGCCAGVAVVVVVVAMGNRFGGRGAFRGCGLGGD